MPSVSVSVLSEKAVALLRDADRTILALAGGSRYLLYHFLRVTAAQFARTDSFYIGFCRDDNKTIVFPYNFDGREYDDPNINPYVSGGLTEWILRYKRSYWSKRDGEALLHRGRAFGDTSRQSAEGIAVPLLETDSRGRPHVLGILSLLSYEADVYTDETVRFLECLADSLVTVLRREDEDQARRVRLGLGTGKTLTTPSVPQTVHLFSERLRTIRRQAESARALTSDEALVATLDTLCQQCEEAQTEAYELLLRAATPPNNPLDQLTEREREVAIFLAQGLTNKAIGTRLFLSDKTVKTHVSNILGKLNAGGRSGVAERLKGFIPETTPME